MNKTEQISVNSDSITLREFIKKTQAGWKFLLSKWKIIFFAGVIGGAVGLAYAFIKKPIYKAELSFALQDDKTNGLSGALGLASQFGLDIGGSVGGEFNGDNLLELIKSRSMITRALLTTVILKNKKQTLADYYIDFNEFRKGWNKKPELANIDFPPGCDTLKFSLKQDSILGEFFKTLIEKNLMVDKVDKKLSIITVKVDSKDELFSKYFAEVLTKVVSNFYTQTKTEKAAKNFTILERQTDSVRRILNGAVSGVAASLDANPNPNPNLSALKVPSQHKQIDVTTNGAILTQLVTNKEIARMALLQATPLIQVIDKPILPLEKEKISKVKGLLIGGVIGTFLMIFWILGRSFFKEIMQEP